LRANPGKYDNVLDKTGASADTVNLYSTFLSRDRSVIGDMSVQADATMKQGVYTLEHTITRWVFGAMDENDCPEYKQAKHRYILVVTQIYKHRVSETVVEPAELVFEIGFTGESSYSKPQIITVPGTCAVNANVILWLEQVFFLKFRYIAVNHRLAYYTRDNFKMAPDAAKFVGKATRIEYLYTTLEQFLQCTKHIELFSENTAIYPLAVNSSLFQGTIHDMKMNTHRMNICLRCPGSISTSDLWGYLKILTGMHPGIPFHSIAYNYVNQDQHPNNEILLECLMSVADDSTIIRIYVHADIRPPPAVVRLFTYPMVAHTQYVFNIQFVALISYVMQGTCWQFELVAKGNEIIRQWNVETSGYSICEIVDLMGNFVYNYGDVVAYGFYNNVIRQYGTQIDQEPTDPRMQIMETMQNEDRFALGTYDEIVAHMMKFKETHADIDRFRFFFQTLLGDVDLLACWLIVNQNLVENIVLRDYNPYNGSPVALLQEFSQSGVSVYEGTLIDDVNIRLRQGDTTGTILQDVSDNEFDPSAENQYLE
jgi:hypothetical protein